MCKYVVWRSKGSIKSSVTFLRKSGTQDKSPESFGTVRNECEQVLKTFGRQSKNSLARDVVDSCPSVHELSQYCFPATAFDLCQFALGPARPCVASYIAGGMHKRVSGACKLQYIPHVGHSLCPPSARMSSCTNGRLAQGDLCKKCGGTTTSKR